MIPLPALKSWTPRRHLIAIICWGKFVALESPSNEVLRMAGSLRLRDDCVREELLALLLEFAGSGMCILKG